MLSSTDTTGEDLERQTDLALKASENAALRLSRAITSPAPT